MPEIRKTVFDDLPHKVHVKILEYLSQNERQKKRVVCSEWNQLINEDFPIKINITNNNCERLFQCPKANHVTVSSLTVEYNGKIAFKDSLHCLEITGKVLSSNIIRLLSACQQIETLIINSPKDVLGIENNEALGLPKLKTLEFKVRMDQETFTRDELILINTLRNIKFGKLEKVLVTVKDFGSWNQDEDDADMDDSIDDFSQGQSVIFMEALSIMSDEDESTNHIPVAYYPSLDLQSSSDTGFTRIVAPESESQQGTQLSMILIESSSDLGALVNIAPEPSAEPMNVQSQQHPIQVDESSGMTDTRSRETTYSRVGVAEYEFASRLFNARMRMFTRNSIADLDTFLNEPVSRGRPGFFGNPFIATANVPANIGLKTTTFFEILKNNGENLKVFLVKARPDFVCFGNISSFPRDSISKIQLEDVEYSFGRSERLCAEHILLESQSKLRKLKLNILDDMWSSVMAAAEKSQATFSELDIRILSLSEEPINLQTLSGCKSLKILKLFHFFDKQNLSNLPNSLNKLILNGPVTKEDLRSFATRLENLVDFTLILNYKPSEKIDLPLFQQFAVMPKIRKLVFIQTQIDVEAVLEYCEGNQNILVTIQGPKELKEPYTLTSFIQCVLITVNHESSENISNKVLLTPALPAVNVL